jgi:predicted kinase
MTSTYRFREERIHAGDHLYAIGNLCTMRGDADAPTSAEAARALLAAWKRDQASLRARFDAGDDGVIDAQEWESARRAAMQEVAAERRRRLSEP